MCHHLKAFSLHPLVYVKMVYVSIFPDPPHANVPVMSRILQELTRFGPELTPNNVTGTTGSAVLSEHSSQILTTVQDGTVWFRDGSSRQKKIVESRCYYRLFGLTGILMYLKTIWVY